MLAPEKLVEPSFKPRASVMRAHCSIAYFYFSFIFYVLICYFVDLIIYCLQSFLLVQLFRPPLRQSHRRRRNRNCLP